MAYIYRYQLRDLTLRDRTVLTQYAQDIQSVLDEHFNKNLKDSIVEEKYFEFKLYATVPKGLLQEMGRKLKVRLPINIKRYGFVRMEQTLYALVYSLQDDSEDNAHEDIVHIEFIDSMLLEKHDLFMQRANSFFEKISSRGLLREKGYIDNIEDVIKNYYIDILEAYIDKHSIPEFLKSAEEKSCFLVKGFHRHNANEQAPAENMLLLENCFDVGYVENREDINGSEVNRTSRSDYLKINASEEHPELIERIESELKLYLSATEKIDALNYAEENSGVETRRKCEFKVHDVGQALATSLSYENAPPFLYFDYGMPYGRNSFTRPAQVNMPTNPGATIIISHVDKDHWFRIADDFNAYQCHWFIPDQPRRTQLNHKFAEIIVHGGSVHIIDTDVAFQAGKLTYGGVSRINPCRAANHVHEKGLTMRIQTHDVNGEELNILIAGDQRYDYVEQAQLNDLDILVASHHGGTFCWSTRGIIPMARNPITSVAIYSYGLDNTHHHPSKLTDYNAADWQQAHHTCNNGDFVITITL